MLPSVIEAEEKARLKKLQQMESTRQSSRLEEKRKEQELLKVSVYIAVYSFKGRNLSPTKTWSCMIAINLLDSGPAKE